MTIYLVQSVWKAQLKELQKRCKGKTALLLCDKKALFATRTKTEALIWCRRMNKRHQDSVIFFEKLELIEWCQTATREATH